MLDHPTVRSVSALAVAHLTLFLSGCSEEAPSAHEVVAAEDALVGEMSAAKPVALGCGASSSAASAAAFALLPQLQAADVFTIDDVSVSGDGCRIDDTAIRAQPSDLAFTFGKFSLAAADATTRSKTCDLVVTFATIAEVRVKLVGFRGSALVSLPQGVNAELRMTPSFSEAAGAGNWSRTVPVFGRGDPERTFVFDGNIPESSRVASACGGPGKLRIALRVDILSPADAAVRGQLVFKEFKPILMFVPC
jgi:hypothetical protein